MRKPRGNKISKKDDPPLVPFKVDPGYAWAYRGPGNDCRKGKRPLQFWLEPGDLALIKDLAAASKRRVQNVLNQMVQHCLKEGGYK
jgi:hypothetical protein